MVNKDKEYLPPSYAFPRLTGEHARARDKREVREENDGNERGARAESDGASPLSLIINSNIPRKVIASDWGQGRGSTSGS